VDIDRSAPVIAAGEIEVSADPETVWAVISDLERWPSWNPEVKSLELEGDVAEGSVFRWKAGPGTITSTLRVVDRPRMIGWTGKTLGIGAVDIYRLEPKDTGTVVRTEESWDGLLARLLRGRMRKTLQGSIDAGLDRLKAEAERRATSSAQ
jgi:carbon monoxide dehydrogenase subunit G